MKHTHQLLEQAMQRWQQGRASVEEVQSLAADIGNRHFEPGIPALFELLDHEDDIVRHNAAMSLAFDLHHVPAAEKLLVMLADDSDGDVRGVAASGLGNLLQNTKDRRILQALAQVALNDADEYVRSAAYKSLQIVNGVSREKHLEILRDESRAVDTRQITAILKGIST